MVLPNIKMNPPQVYMCSPSWTLLPPPSPYHPSGSSQCTSPKHPELSIEPGLVTHSIYDIIRISMPFSQIIPPSPSPTESKRLFYTSVSLLLSHIQGRQRMWWLDGITDSMDMIWVNSRSCWWTGRPGVLGFMGSQRVGQDWPTDLFWSRLVIAFLPRSNCLLISWLQSLSTVIWSPKK